MSVLEILAAPMTQIGKIPDHVALILDGNRRYAKSRGLPALKGHQAGYAFCLTVFLFSIENFKRAKEEVDDLMELIFIMCTNLMKQVDAGTIMDTSFQVIGNWEGLLPVKLQHRMAHLMIKTRHFKPYRFNMAVAYTGRQGILQSLNAFPDSKDEIMDNLRPSEYLIAQAQHLVDMSPVDMLIRTGGNLRLSDFMMWETSQAYIHFVPETWPEFSFWKLVHAILLYQVYRGSAEKVIKIKIKDLTELDQDQDQDQKRQPKIKDQDNILIFDLDLLSEIMILPTSEN
ncbi:dehydrodolichyl diphosphate synthase complex subunit Dhdds [Folsomia candida]|uniref:dehydrodolichyl diphosphate synthase complex subunit Dhdds n=1 Tax=Folsomia candida TaxID=158441 RepID=UPI001604CF40|nr:dehydrodolichyl diphosphate synthase complex subunit Dhdds [Folsomia candida]